MGEDKKTLRVRCIQKNGVADFDPAYLFDEGSTIEWTPSGKKLASSAPGVKFASGPDTFYVESCLSNTSTRYYGEMTQSMIALANAPGSDNGTGLMQTIAAFKIRELYEKKAAANKLASQVAAAVSA